ncbi:MAG: class I SAM-dependent methyltransferase [Gemmatimonadota bacterium]|nr:class I SAM-dependent methyltransferase [Gemmatimonadota bacterium]
MASETRRPSGAPRGAAGTAGSGDYYARRVASPEYRASRADRAEVILHLLHDEFEAAGRIADVGSGTGIMKTALEIASRKPITGFELDVQFVVDRNRVVGADAVRLPVRDGTFDLVILNHIYEHVGDQPGLFREAWRVLRDGGTAYVSAGNRFAVMEPHYRLPFLSWLPRGVADRYLRATGRGSGYEGVAFLTYGRLTGIMRAAGFGVRDITGRALEELLGPERGASWMPAWAVLERLPQTIRESMLRAASPQWFFLLEKRAPDV